MLWCRRSCIAIAAWKIRWDTRCGPARFANVVARGSRPEIARLDRSRNRRAIPPPSRDEIRTGHLGINDAVVDGLAAEVATPNRPERWRPIVCVRISLSARSQMENPCRDVAVSILEQIHAINRRPAVLAAGVRTKHRRPAQQENLSSVRSNAPRSVASTSMSPAVSFHRGARVRGASVINSVLVHVAKTVGGFPAAVLHGDKQFGIKRRGPSHETCAPGLRSPSSRRGIGQSPAADPRSPRCADACGLIRPNSV